MTFGFLITGGSWLSGTGQRPDPPLALLGPSTPQGWRVKETVSMTSCAAVEKLPPYRVAPCVELTRSFKISLLSCDSRQSILWQPSASEILRRGSSELGWFGWGNPVTQRRASTPTGVSPVVCPEPSLSMSFFQKNYLYN